MWARTILRGRSLAGVGLGAVAFAASLLIGSVPDEQLTVKADLDVSGGTAVELFLNDFSERPGRVPVSPGRHDYRFAGVFDSIEVLRLDPTDGSGAQVRVYGIDILGPGGESLKRFGADEIGGWSTSGLEMVARGPEVVVYRTVSADPIIVARIDPVRAVDTTDPRAGLAKELRADPWLPCVLLLPLVCLLDVRPWRPWLLRLAALSAALALAPPVYEWVAAMDWGGVPARVAVSRAAFLGLSLTGAQMGVALPFLLVALVGAVSAWWRPYRDESPAPGQPSIMPPARFIAVAVALLAVVTAPDLPARIAALSQYQYTPHWDSDNLQYWAFWTSRGALPFRDFWYPYAGLFLMDLSWPAGPIVQWTVPLLSWGTFMAALALAAPGRPWSVLLAAAVVMTADEAGLTPNLHRYLLGVNVVLAYAGARRWQFRGALARLTLGLALLLPLIIEPAQIIYAVPGVAAVAALDVLRQRSLEPLWRGPAFCAGVLGAAAVLLALTLWWHDMLAAVWVYHSRLGDTVEYAAFPAVVATTWWDPQLVSVVPWLPVVILAIGVAEYQRPDRDGETRAVVTIGLAALTLMVLQKHLVRPMPETLMLHALVAGVGFAVCTPVSRVGRRGWGLAIAAGVFTAVALLGGRVERVRETILTAPGRLVSSVSTLADPEASALFNRIRFAPGRFGRYTAQRRLVEQLTLRRGDAVSLFSLSDDPMLYVLTAQPPLWVPNLYNASPSYDQERLVAGFLATPPHYIVADQARLSFDDVPLAVRAPEVIAHVLAHYVPDAPVDGYQVWRRRAENESLRLAPARDLLGPTLDLGMLPDTYASDRPEPCAEEMECDRYLLIQAPSAVADGRVSLTVSADDVELQVTFRTRPGQAHYLVPASRLWPWRLAASAGWTVIVTPPAGFSVTAYPVRRQARHLY